MNMTKKNILKTFVFASILTLVFGVSSFAAVLDPTIPRFPADTLSLQSDGTASFELPAYIGGWKRFDIQLLKRVTTVNPSNNVVTYTYKTQGSIKQVDPTDKSYTFTISSVGYYQFQIRGVNLEGNYGEWIAIYDNSTWASRKTEYPGVAVDEDDISAGGGGSHSGGIGPTDYYYGPGVINNNQMLPYGYQNYYIGPNGQIIYTNPYQQYGYNNNNYNPNQGTYSYPQVPSPYGTNNQYGYNQYGYNQYGYNNGYNQYGYNANGMTNPNYYNGGVGNNVGNYSQGTNNNYNPNTYNNTGTPQISQGLEIGWHVDSNGRFYYQGNGVVLKGTWYFIDGSYYRFSDNGYLLVNQWFRDNTTGFWYYLGGDGRMLVGWQCINGVWYYFKPENGNGFGTMYMNTSLQINDAQYGSGIYAFDANGAMVRNAWFGGYYYGSDGNRRN